MIELCCKINVKNSACVFFFFGIIAININLKTIKTNEKNFIIRCYFYR
jgi:hypothetical protein